jgi:hypothetical protein
MNAKQYGTFVRIMLEMPLAVVNGPISASGPEEYPSIKALDEVFETVALR